MNARVLIVDDDAMSQDILTLLLRQRGHVTRSLYRGERLNEAADAFAPDVVLLDVRMPGMSGLEAARRLRARAEFALLPIVGMSGFGTDADKLAATDAGFTAYLVKPVDYVVLTAMITTYAPRRAAVGAVHDVPTARKAATPARSAPTSDVGDAGHLLPAAA